VRWPAGIQSSGVACGLKEAVPDLGVIAFDRPTPWAGVFTQNAAAAAPVHWCRRMLGAPVRALVVNSGNANACTGPAGDAAVRATVDAAALEVGCSADEVLVASTGPIGIPLPVDLVCAGLPNAIAEAGDQVETFAGAILTTDSVIKTASSSAGDATIVGVAKGAAMIAPNMATMLAFIATDAELSAAELQELLGVSVEVSFNRISIDACESTNDSVFAFATGMKQSADRDALATSLTSVCRSLAEQIVRDAEGGSRLVRIRIDGAPDEQRAVALGRAVAASALWRAATHGADPNWGRVLAALGSIHPSLDLAATELSIGPEVVFSGAPCGSLDVAAKAMAEPEFTVSCSLGAGGGTAEILTADLSSEYVALNAAGTS
jgi:glutamate N-acetyltransferase/amino-acid N-acetyltransferase